MRGSQTEYWNVVLQKAREASPASCVAALLAILAGLYQLRLRLLKNQFNVSLEARLGERTRIARDLHDTLLQSFQGVLLKFHTVTYLLPDRPEAREKLENCIEEAGGDH